MLKKSLYEIGKNFSMVIVAQIAYKIMLFITFILIARNLGVIGFGKFSYAMAFAGLITVLADLGTSSSLIKDTSGIDRHNTDQYLSDILSIKLIGSIAAIIIVFLLGYFLHESRQVFNVIIACIIICIFNSYIVAFRAVFRVFEKMKYDALSIFLEGFLKLSLIILFVHFLKDNVAFILMILLIANAIVLLITAYIVDKKFVKIRFSVKVAAWPRIINSGAVFAFVSFFQIANLRIGTVMLSKMTTDSETGIYSVVTRIIEPLLAVPLTFIAVSFPVLSRLYKESTGLFNDLKKVSVRTICVVSMIIAVLIYFTAEVVVTKILGVSYAAAGYALKIFCWIFIPMSIRFVLEGAALASNKRKKLYFAYTAGTIANICINALLISMMGYKGAAVGIIVSEFIMLIFLWN